MNSFQCTVIGPQIEVVVDRASEIANDPRLRETGSVWLASATVTIGIDIVAPAG